jgi:hypothetical protein
MASNRRPYELNVCILPYVRRKRNNIFRQRPIAGSDTDLVLITDKAEDEEESPYVFRQRQAEKNGIDAISVLSSSSHGGTSGKNAKHINDK